MTSDRHLNLMALMREIEAPTKAFNRSVRLAASTETDTPANSRAIDSGKQALDDIERAVRRWVTAHPQQDAGEQPEFTEARAAFMQIGRTPSLEGLRAELRIEGWPPIAGAYCGASMGRMHDVPGHEHLLAVDPRLIFEYAEAPAAVETGE